MTLCTPMFQRSDACGTRSPKPVTESSRPPDTREADRPDRGVERGVDGRAGAAIGDDQRHCGLSAQDRCREHVARDRHRQVAGGIEVGVEVAGEVRGDVAARDLAREGDVGARRHRGVVVDGGQGEARLLRRRREAAEEARHPEAHAAFVRRRDRGCHGERGENEQRCPDAARILRPLWSSSCPPTLPRGDNAARCFVLRCALVAGSL